MALADLGNVMGPPGVNTLSSCSDTEITNPTVDDVLEFNGNKWENSDALNTSLAEVKDEIKVSVYNYQNLTKENALNTFINDGHIVAGQHIAATLRTSDAYYNCDFIRGGSTTTGWGINLTNASDRFTFRKPDGGTISLSTF